ncbi:GTPase-activator protein for Ras family GTPase [Acanthamoeba castellanii str. Neff]|uniref:GTPase-activator protein for Ras family GTPase n=1 Tax=Acanthamoeba castellanii (strain ATCC 30010 / Neff) TaxID=1257118 RepID=L8HDJ8_ACACF|nr:GTPase-activator protein for Ras family GTPase [Acanthamoeba castellanii str. Neff]ELR22471.1 GTPase-activator protein for Ras family GTPase [Acanthamoeba castellanii str. Neff]
MSGIFYHFTRGETISRGDKSHNGNRRASSPSERPALRSTATTNAAAATSPSSSPRQARARGMLRKMKAKVGEAISPRERNEIARAAASSSPAEGYNLELDFASPGLSPSSSPEGEPVPEACRSGMKRRPSVTIMEEWNEYYHDADDSGALGGGPRGTVASRTEGEDTEKKKKVDLTSALEATQAEAQQRVEERDGEEYEDYGDDDDEENWEEGYIMVDVGSEKEVATRLPSNGDNCMVIGEEAGGELSVPASASAVEAEATAENTKNNWKNGTIYASPPTKTVLATNSSTDGEEEDDDEDDEDHEVSDTEWGTTTTPEEGLPAVPAARSKPRFKLLIPQRKDPGHSPEGPSHSHSGSLSAGRDYQYSTDMRSLGFLTPSPLRKQQARNSSSPRGEHMAGGRKALSALSLMASLAPIGHASFCSDLDTARKVLMSPKLQLVTQLSKRVDPADYNTIAQTLVKIFEANGKAMDLLEWAIRQEISSSLDQHTVLREDSLWNQIIAQDFTLIGGNYLRQLLRTEKVAESASLLLKEICSSLSYCPSQISSVCYILHKELSKHFPTGRGHGSVIGSFYMLRFICPALVSPVKMGFVDSQQNNNLPAEVMRHLVAVAKLLQSLANTSMQASFLQPQHQHASAAEKERSMRWEKFLRTKIPLYHEFIAGLTSESLFLKSTTAASSQHYTTANNQAGAAMTNTISGLRVRCVVCVHSKGSRGATS